MEIEHSRQRLINECDQSRREAELLRQRMKFDHEEEMFRLRNQQLKELVDSFIRLPEPNGESDRRIVNNVKKELLGLMREKPPALPRSSLQAPSL